MKTLRNFLLAGGLAAMAWPLAALAQMGPPGAPPPQMRAQFEQARTQARTAAMNDLSADHRTKVQAIVTQVQKPSGARRSAKDA